MNLVADARSSEGNGTEIECREMEQVQELCEHVHWMPGKNIARVISSIRGFCAFTGSY